MIDILMITYNRLVYTGSALEQLLLNFDPRARVWIWQNGSDSATLKVASWLRDHPRVHKFHHSVKNKKSARRRIGFCRRLTETLSQKLMTIALSHGTGL